MQKNTVELMDEVEQDLSFDVEKKPEPKEYEKLLLADANRASYVQACNLVKLGCFEQIQETKVDFSKYERIDAGKKFKGKYQLFRNIETLQLVFILPLVENNKNDENERLDLAPYAYDCIYVEHMDAETYEMVLKANQNSKKGLKISYYAGIVLYFVNLVFSFATFLLVFIQSLITTTSTDKLYAAITNAVYVAGAPLAVAFAATPLLVLMLIKYNKNRE